MKLKLDLPSDDQCLTDNGLINIMPRVFLIKRLMSLLLVSFDIVRQLPVYHSVHSWPDCTE